MCSCESVCVVGKRGHPLLLRADDRRMLGVVARASSHRGTHSARPKYPLNSINPSVATAHPVSPLPTCRSPANDNASAGHRDTEGVRSWAYPRRALGESH